MSTASAPAVPPPAWCLLKVALRIAARLGKVKPARRRVYGKGRTCLRGCAVGSAPVFKLVLPLAAALLVGCAAGSSSGDIFYDPCEPVVIVPQEGVTPAQLKGINTAIELWSKAGVTSLTLDTAPGRQQLRVYFKDALAIFHGVYEPSIGEVRINNSMTARALDITVAHEIGHAIGLPHIPRHERDSVMNPSNETTAPTGDDAKQLRERWLCSSPSP